MLMDLSTDFAVKLETKEGYERFYLSFYMFSSLIGFVLLRFWQAVEQPNEVVHRVLDPELSPNVGQEQLLDSFLDEMGREYELLSIASRAGRGLFDIAVDNEDDPQDLAVVPCVNESVAESIIRFHLIDSSAEWSQTFYQLISNKIKAMGWYGWGIHFDENLISTHYNLFSQAWKEIFGVTTLGLKG